MSRRAIAIALAAVAAVILYRLLRQASGPAAPGPSSGPPATESEPNRSAVATSTRADLYKQAQRLEISGRSSMNKEQLERAIEAAKRAGA